MANLQIIKSLCEQRLISIDQLGEKIGLKRGAIYKMMTENSTKIETLEKISNVLDVPVNIFFDQDTTLITNPNNPKNQNSMISPESIENLIRQNGELVKQVSEMIAMQGDLIEMQKLNAETINNFSSTGLKKKAS